MSGHTTTPPEPTAVRPFLVPEIGADRLDTGLEIRTIPLSRIPLISVSLMIDVGEARMDHGEAGRAVLVGNALQGGTARHSGADLAEAIESIGASLAVGTSWDGTRVALSVLADHLPEALDLMADVVRRPTFPSDEVARVRDQRLAAIQQERTEPGRLAELSLRAQLYDPAAPYSRPLGGTQESVEGFDADAAQALFDSSYGPSIGVVAVGDLDPDHIRALLQERFGDWTGGWKRAPAPNASPRTSERRVVVVHRPGAVQSEIRIGHVGPPRSIPEYFSLRVANGALGGTFGSRLNLNLREKHGFTYGVRSRLGFGRGPGPFSIATAVETAVTAAAVREAMAEFTKLADEGPTEDEVSSIRDFLSGVFPLQMETTAQLNRQAATLLVHDLPADYLTTYRDNIRAVTRDSAAEAARRYFLPDQAQIVVVGDADAIQGELESLSLGPLEVVEPS